MSSDPFKRAVYCVLAGCDVRHLDHTEVCCKTDDYMWLKVCERGVPVASLPGVIFHAVNIHTFSSLQSFQLAILTYSFFFLDFLPLVYFRKKLQAR